MPLNIYIIPKFFSLEDLGVGQGHPLSHPPPLPPPSQIRHCLLLRVGQLPIQGAERMKNELNII
jgi:hypothetical protein